MACLRVCHSLYITPRALGHVPAALVSDPNGRLQHNVSRHKNGRKSSAQVKVCPAQIRCAVRSKTLSLGRPANITSVQPVFLSAVGSARKHAGMYLRGLQEWASLYEDSAAYMQWIWQRGVSLLLSFATWRAVEGVRQPGDLNCFVTLTRLLGLPIRTGHL